MKKISLYILLITIGLVIGGGISWVYSYYPERPYVKDKISIEDILRYSNTTIAENNFSCEGDTKLNVGAVTASIIELNNLNKRNSLTFGCYQNICTLMVSNCLPWKSQECGNRILKLETNEEDQILPSTFSCIDVP